METVFPSCGILFGLGITFASEDFRQPLPVVALYDNLALLDRAAYTAALLQDLAERIAV